MTQDPFFLPTDYKPNTHSITLDSVSGQTYWTPARLKSAQLYQYPVYKFALQVMRDENFKSLVDVGCGPGVKLRMIHDALPGISITGVDQADPIRFCQDHHHFGTWITDNIEAPVHAVPPADMVICADVIEHVMNPDAVLNYLASLVSKNGLIVLSTPDRDRILNARALTPSNPNHIREWTMNELRDYLVSRGFEILQHFHQLPWKLSWARPVLAGVARHIFFNMPSRLQYNQIVVMRPKRD